MRTRKKLVVAGLAVSCSLALTACDPPIPPEILASLAEQTYTCIEGQASVAGPESMREVLLGWADYLSYSCVDPEPTMSLTPTTLDDPEAKIVVSEYPSTCKAELSVPLAVEASVIVFQDSEVGSLNLSAESIAAMMNGEISNWNQLSSDNPGSVMPDKKLFFRKVTDKAAFDAMETFLKNSQLKVGQSVFAPEEKVTLDQYADWTDGYWTPNLQEGEIALMPNSFAIQLGFYPANIYLGLDEEQLPIVASPNVTGISTATTQWDYTQTTSGLTVKLNVDKEPTPPDGSEVAPPSYQAIYPITMNLCKADSVSRAIARFVLRLDNQGSLAVSNYSPLPEFVRIPSLVLVSQGLPTPEPTEPTQ